MRNNAAYLPESPIVYIILPKSIRNRASFRIFDFVEDTPARQCSNKFDIALVYSYLCYPEIGLNKTYFALHIVYFIA